MIIRDDKQSVRSSLASGVLFSRETLVNADQRKAEGTTNSDQHTRNYTRKYMLFFFR